MGTDFVEYLRKNVTKQQMLALISTFLATLMVHLYFLTNTLPNRDAVQNYYSTQNILASGRWALSMACGFGSYFDLPWVNGIISSVFIALTVAVVITLFRIKNPVLIVLTGCLFAASPATTETLFFLYTADGYMIAMFLAALAVYWSRIGERRKSRWIFSAACICICCGIYQAYVSFGLILAVCYFMLKLLENRYDKAACLRWVFRQVWIYGSALLVYYIVWKVAMRFTGTVPSEYQGIENVGQMSVQLIWHAVIQCVKDVVIYFIQWDVSKYGFTPYVILNLMFIGFFIVGLWICVKESGTAKRPWALGLVLLCLIAIIPFVGIWNFVSDGVVYGFRMQQSMTILFVFCGVIFEVWAGKVVKNAVALLLLLIVLNNSIMANIGYFYLNLCYERTYSEGVEMMIEIHDLPDYQKAKRIAVLGSRYRNVTHFAVDPATDERTTIGQIQTLMSTMDSTLLYDANHTVPYLRWVFGLKLEQISRGEEKQLLQSVAVRQMPCWPEEGAICMMDDTLIIKLAEE